MSPSSLLAQVRRGLFAFGLMLAAPSAALEVAARREPLPDAGVLVGLSRLELNGPHALGGLSAILWLTPDRLLFASDRGRLFTATLVRDGGALADLRDWEMREPPLPGGWSNDLEGLALSEGELLVSIEEAPHVLRFSGPPSRPKQVISYFTRDDLGLKINKGFEALVDLPGDGWLAVSEGLVDETHLALTRDGHRHRYAAPQAFAPTGADRHGDRLFFVERRVGLIGGWQARVTCLAVADLAEEGTLRPVELARLGAADGIDNMEGIAVRAAGDDLEFLVVSDDNQTPFQRTLVLHYRWPDGARRSRGCGS